MPSGPRERTPGIWRYHISRGPIRVMAWDLEEAETMFLMRAGELQQRDD